MQWLAGQRCTRATPVGDSPGGDLLSVLSRQALLADAQAVDRATVISLRAVMVYVLLPLNHTASLVSAFVAVFA
jgi:hypothetical protein